MDSPDPIDAELRLARFERAHPEVLYSFDAWSRVHRAVVPLTGNSSQEIVRFGLGELLDRLDDIVANGG